MENFRRLVGGSVYGEVRYADFVAWWKWESLQKMGLNQATGGFWMMDEVLVHFSALWYRLIVWMTSKNEEFKAN